MATRKNSSKRTSARPAPRKEAPATRVPDAPIYRFDGIRQPPTFSAGVEAFRAFIVSAHAKREPANDRAFAEKYAAQFVDALLVADPDFAFGYATALGEWLAIDRHSIQDAAHWVPLYTQAASRLVNGVETYDEPAPHSLLFEVDGAPVAVTEDLCCHLFGPTACDDFDDFDIDVVRQRGKPIARERFDELRAAPTMASAAAPASGAASAVPSCNDLVGELYEIDALLAGAASIASDIHADTIRENPVLELASLNARKLIHASSARIQVLAERFEECVAAAKEASHG